MPLAIITNPYKMIADITGMGAMTTDKMQDVYEDFLDEQIELMAEGKDERKNQARLERKMNASKLELKNIKLQAKLDAKKAEIAKLTTP